MEITKKYKPNLYLFALGVIFFGITMMWQDSLGDESKTTDYFWNILCIQIVALLMMIVSSIRIIIIKLIEISKR